MNYTPEECGESNGATWNGVNEETQLTFDIQRSAASGSQVSRASKCEIVTQLGSI
jgi:hypothetical protein